MRLCDNRAWASFYSVPLGCQRGPGTHSISRARRLTSRFETRCARKMTLWASHMSPLPRGAMSALEVGIHLAGSQRPCLSGFVCCQIGPAILNGGSIRSGELRILGTMYTTASSSSKIRTFPFRGCLFPAECSMEVVQCSAVQCSVVLDISTRESLASGEVHARAPAHGLFPSIKLRSAALKSTTAEVPKSPDSSAHDPNPGC